MAPVQQTLILRDWTRADVLALVPSCEANPWGPLEDAVDVLSGSHLFEFRDGTAHALLAVRPVPCAHGVRADVVGLVSSGTRLTAEQLHALGVQIACTTGAAMLAMTTLRPHLARACVRAGWVETGKLLTLDARALQ